MSSANRPLFAPGDIAEAIALLTRIPLPMSTGRGAQAAWAWPLAGLVVALIAGVLGWLTLAMGLPAPLVAGVILGAQVMLTGALHEDGLADTADGFWGGATPARRLEIMQDSRIGSYGVLALGLGLILRWAALAAILETGALFAPLIAAAVLSRAPMAILLAALPAARQGGLAASVGRPGRKTAAAGLALAMALAFLVLGWGVIAPAFWVALASIAAAALAKAKIGGQTGDVLGAAQQIAEVAALAALAASL